MTSNITIGCNALVNCNNTVQDDGDLQIYNISEQTALMSDPNVIFTVVSQSDSLHAESGVDITTYQSVLLGPEWTAAKHSWGYAWEIHVYFLGGLFGLVELYNIANVVRFWRCQRLLPTGYFVCLHATLACICLMRSVYLLYCGYDSQQTYHVSLNHFLYTMPFPCLTSGFSILFSWILRAADLHLVPFALLKLQMLLPIIVVHYILTITTNVLIGYSAIMQFVSHAFFIAWSLYLFFGYTYIFRKLYSHVVINQTRIGNLSYGRSLNNADKVQREMTIGTAVKITFSTAACGLAISGLEAYAFVDVYKMFTRAHPKPWSWWLYHSVLRLLEFFVCLTMSYTISLPLRYPHSPTPIPSAPIPSSLLRALYSFCCNYKASGINIRKGWNLFRQRFSVNSVHGNNSNTTEYLSTRYPKEGYSDTAQMVKTQSQLCAKSNSLVIVDDVYVRFETDHDINRIVDSINESHRRPVAFNQISRITELTDFDNTGNTVENVTNEEGNINGSHRNVDESVRSNTAKIEMFRAPSSVSIVESIEKELIRVFENFKTDQNDVDDAQK